MRAPSCVPFWILPTWIQSSRLRLIEHRASYAPCSILQADTLDGPASPACFIEWCILGTMNLRGNRVLLYNVYVRLLLALPGTTAFLDGDRQTSHSPRSKSSQQSHRR